MCCCVFSGINHIQLVTGRAASGGEQMVSLGPGGGVTMVPSTRTCYLGWEHRASRIMQTQVQVPPLHHLLVVFLDHTRSLSLNFFLCKVRIKCLICHWEKQRAIQTLEDSRGQAGLVCCCPLGYKESDTLVIEQQQKVVIIVVVEIRWNHTEEVLGTIVTTK